MSKANQMQVVWFKREFRITDNECLFKAAAKGPVLAIYAYEPDLWKQNDVSYRHYLFVHDCINDLQHQLATINGNINIYSAPIIDILNRLRAKYDSFELWSHQETGNYWTYQRDKDVRRWCKDESITFNEPLQFGVWRGKHISRNGWAKAWDKMMSIQTYPVPSKVKFLVDTTSEQPSAEQLGLAHDGIVSVQKGGRAEGLKILSSFLYERGEAYRTDMSSPITGEKGCSRMSPHIALGCVSMREVYQSTRARQNEVKALPKEQRGTWPGALQSFIGRLHWHCHFTQKLELEPELEFLPMARAYTALRPTQGIKEKLVAFEHGRTGFPFIDACMRYLKATGWINFRMRAMLMSFASYDLFVPWQESGAILARYFTDYEAGIHWPQSQMQSGVTGINAIRIYSPVKQGMDQDPSGVFTKRWVPELRDVPVEFLHEPWEHGIKTDYPPPIVDHKEAVKESRNKVWEIKKTADAKAEAEQVYLKHGSRKESSRNRNMTKKTTVNSNKASAKSS